MAARNLTGSAWIRAAGSKSGTEKKLPALATWMGYVRVVTDWSFESRLGHSVRVDADATAVLHRRAYHPLTSLLACSGRRVARPA